MERGQRLESINAALSEWRQGDCVLGEHWLVLRFDPSIPLSDGAVLAAAADPETSLAESAVRGLALLSQTCDVVRDCADRPFVEVAPLVELDPEAVGEVERGYRPRYGYVPSLKSAGLVVDLDRVMTVEKAVVASWTRVVGAKNDEESRAFAEALKRKRGRFAFPDEFAEQVVPGLTKRLRDKHDRNSDEGRALRALQEIRITAEPSWDSESLSLFFWFVRGRGQEDFAGKPWSAWLETWLKLVKTTPQFIAVSGLVVTLADMTAEDYVTSDPLDLDYLSVRGTSPPPTPA